jgi:hypothetical protein
VWEQLTDEQQQTYLHWIASAKTAADRSERVAEVLKLLPPLPAPPGAMVDDGCLRACVLDRLHDLELMP